MRNLAPLPIFHILRPSFQRSPLRTATEDVGRTGSQGDGGSGGKEGVAPIRWTPS